MTYEAKGTLALIGGEGWHEGSRELDRELLDAAGASQVLVLPTAAAYERPERLIEKATAYYDALGAKVDPLMVLHRSEADDEACIERVTGARFIYLTGGSPMHLRSVLKGSRLWDALVDAYRDGAVLAANGSGAVVMCDPMIDPRGGAYTVGLGLLANLAVLPHHDTVAAHLKARALDLLPGGTTLVGIDEHTGLVRDPDASWRVHGAGSVTVYQDAAVRTFSHGAVDALTI